MSDLGLHLRLNTLTLTDFKGFPPLNCIFHTEKNVTLILGNNGGGKSSLLDAIAEHLQLILHELFLRDGTYVSKIGASSVKIGSETMESKAAFELSWNLAGLFNIAEDKDGNEAASHSFAG